MRVAILNPAAELGGAERSLLTFLQGAAGANLDPLVILPREGPLMEALSALGAPWEVVPMPAALLRQSRQNSGWPVSLITSLTAQAPGYLLRLAKALRRFNPEVLYTNGIKTHIIGAFLGPLVGAPVVWHVRDHWGGRFAGRLADLGPRRIIANSHATAGVVRQHMRKPGKVVVVHNAVDVAEFSPEGDIAPWESAGPKVGLVAVLARLKGHRLLLDAAPSILAEFPDTRFFFIGGSIYDTAAENDYDEELRALIGERGLAGQVVITGFQPRMAPWYRAMDIVVNASIQPEGFGRTLLEGMACGKAVVGPEAGGVPEFVRHGKNGLLYPMGDPEALAQAVLTLLRDPALRRRLGASGRQTTVSRFSPERHARVISGMLLEVPF